MYKKNRIGLDIDDLKQGKELLKLLRILKIKGYFRRSSSGRGYHFSLIVNEHNKKDALKIRYMLGDCYGRWIGDVRRLQNGLIHFDILFDKKKNKKAGRWYKI